MARSRANDIVVSPHFRLLEFQCACCGRVMLVPTLLDLLEAIRAERGSPVIVTSGYRCAEHNAAVGGAPRSYHMIGRAADIAMPESEQARMADVARSHGAVEAIKGGMRGYLHVAV